MGERGPGAKPTRKLDKSAAVRISTPRPWQNPRLSRANRVISFIEGLKCTQGKGAGQPFRLRGWQKRILRRVYRAEGGQRVVREVLLTCGRKNGKSETAAAL